jgi:hypothetical protein
MGDAGGLDAGEYHLISWGVRRALVAFSMICVVSGALSEEDWI